jgi:hypothetical protein
VFGVRSLRPLAAQALRELVHAAPGRVQLRRGLPEGAGYDLLLDGVFGFQFRPPVAAPIAALFKRANATPIRLRAAVDLPSGLGGPAVLRANFTYATGSVKSRWLGCVTSISDSLRMPRTAGATEACSPRMSSGRCAAGGLHGAISAPTAIS